MALDKIRVVCCGHIMEVYTYSEGIWTDFQSKGGRRTGEESLNPENRARSARAARKNVLRQLNANFGNVKNVKFVTLTFRDGAVEDVTNVQECNKAFKEFMQRLRYQYGNEFKYLAVIEFQDARGRGAVHYHMLVDLPYIKAKDLADLWGNGFIKINKIDHVDNVGAYVVKYMVKDSGDTRLQGQKAFLGSRNLEKPVVLYGEAAERVLHAYKLGEAVLPVYLASYHNDYLGEVAYQEYNLLRPTGQRTERTGRDSEGEATPEAARPL